MRKVRHLGEKGKSPGNFWEGRRQRRSSWEPGFTSFRGQTLTGGPTRLAPPSKDGVGGFKGYRLCRRPLLNQVQVILCDLYNCVVIR